MSTSTAEAVAGALAGRIEGEVRFDEVSRLLYSTDASLYQVMPLGVVVPRHAGDIVATMTEAARSGLPVLPRGSGTSLGGQAVGEAIVLDCSKYMHRVLSVDVEAATARVQPGVILDELNALLRPSGLAFAPDVATSNRASIGGMMGNNSSGAHSVLYGKTVDHVRSQNVVLSDASEATFQELSPESWRERAARAGREGAIYAAVQRIVSQNADEIDLRFPRIMRRVGGYNLDEFVRRDCRNLARLMVGSEGTLGIVTEATLDLVRLPAVTGLLVAHFDDLIGALEAAPECLAHAPAAVELTDRMILSLGRAHPAFREGAALIRGDPAAILVVEFYGDTREQVEARLADLAGDLERRRMGFAWVPVLAPAAQKEVWNLRKGGLGLLMGMKGDVKPVGFVEDTAVAPECLADYIRAFRGILAGHGCEAAYYAHASVGCLHVRPLLNLKRGTDVARMRSIAEAVSSLVLEFGGAMSAEHGDGLVRSEFQEKMFGPRLYAAFQEIKRAFDPEWLLNPGKVVCAPPMDRNLRFGADYETIRIDTRFDYRRDGGFAGAVELCSGVGACRKKTEGTMCPSYRATLEEEHSTRGRANLLRAALCGRLPAEELVGRRIYAALDLCLECKACKSECPSNVDMAKLKYEFLARYHSVHGMPARARFFAGAAAGSAAASAAAPLANALTRSRAGRWLLERALGIDRRRTLPALAPRTFRSWLRRHPPAPAGRRRVVLLADTFTNYQEPENGIAAVRLLEAAGFCVEVPRLRCCGRPMISKGMLDEAKENAAHNLEVLNGEPLRELPILGLEPSCLSCYLDDYRDLLPGEAAESVAARVAPVEGFLAGEGLRLGPRAGSALLHGHCHQKALYGTGGTLAALRRVPDLAVEEIPSGCCGMAGSFGYEKEHYDLSLQIGELSLFPRVREAPPETLLVATGTSCRQQLRDAVGREAVHPVVALAAQLPAEGPECRT